MKTLLTATSFMCLLAGCASSDPREGGFLGYLQHHKEYNQRLNLMEAQVAQQQADAARLQQENADLTTRNAAGRARLESLLADIDALEHQISTIEKQAAAAPAATALQPEVTASRRQLAAAQDPALTLAEREAILTQLKRDVDALTTRARLLLETQ